MLYLVYKEAEIIYNRLDAKLENDDNNEMSIEEVMLMEKTAKHLNSIVDACCRDRATEKD